MSEKKYIIEIKTQPSFLPDRSDPKTQQFIWSYDISITNESDSFLQLLKRHWEITDMYGKVEVIKGVGVVGLQPLIKPKTTFTYTSWCQLTTPQGTMEGYYEFQDLEETVFRVPIEKFILHAPNFKKAFEALLH